MYGSREKRSFVRWNIHRPMRYRIANQPESEEKIALIKDISFLGARVAFLESLRLNTQLDMVIEIPDEENPFPCRGKVVWQNFVEDGVKRNFVCGLYFSQIEDKDKEKIFRYVWDKTPEETKKRWWEGNKSTKSESSIC